MTMCRGCSDLPTDGSVSAMAKRWRLRPSCCIAVGVAPASRVVRVDDVRDHTPPKIELVEPQLIQAATQKALDGASPSKASCTVQTGLGLLGCRYL